MKGKTFEYFSMAWKDAVDALKDEYDKDSAALILDALGWHTASAALTKMSDEELVAWVENRELPSWMRAFLQLE